MADTETGQQRTTSFAKEVHLDGEKASKLDQTRNMGEAFSKAKTQTSPTQKSAQEIAADLKKREAQSRTSFAKEVKFDHQKANSLDQQKSLREAYSKSQQLVESKKQASGQQQSLGPKPEAAIHLRLPDSAERRAVDSQIHNKQLSEARTKAKERAAQVANDLKQRQGRDQQQSHSRGR